MSDVTNFEKSPTMTKPKGRPASATVKVLLAANPDGLREVVRAVMQEVLEAEMTDALAAEKGERTPTRLGHRAGYYTRTLVACVGKLELRVPHDRDGRGGSGSARLGAPLPAPVRRT
jgi:transposase-like protein